MNTYIHICEKIVFNLFLPVENSQFGALRGRARAAGTNGKEIGNVRTLHTARICRIHIHKFHAGDMLNSHVEKASGGCWCAAPDIDFSAEFFSAALWTSRTIEILLYVCAVVLSNDENHAACTVSVSSGVFGFRIISKSKAKS